MPLLFTGLVAVVTAAVLFMSYWPLRNMLSSRQRMNMSFNSFHLVNTYRAFGSIGRIRRAVVIEGTEQAVITAQTVWQEYEFKGRQGALRRLPRRWAPCHLRLDWLMWFAAISPGYAQPWLKPFLQRLLRNDSPACVCCGTTPSRIRRHGLSARNSINTNSPTSAELRRDRAWRHRRLEGRCVAPMALADAAKPAGA